MRLKRHQKPILCLFMGFFLSVLMRRGYREEALYVVSDFEKRFGTMAVEKGYVTKEQLLEAMRIQVEQDLDGIEHRLIGSILFSMGYMTLEQVNEVIEAIKEDAGA